MGLEIKNLELLTKFTIYVVNNVIQSDKKYPKSLMKRGNIAEILPKMISDLGSLQRGRKMKTLIRVTCLTLKATKSCH